MEFHSGQRIKVKIFHAELVNHEIFFSSLNRGRICCKIGSFPPPDAVQFVKQILQQILASIKVTNIERYITEVERIRGDIQARNFSVEDADALVELENAKTCEFVFSFLGGCFWKVI